MFRREKKHDPLPPVLQQIVISYIPIKSPESEQNLNKEEKTVFDYTLQGIEKTSMIAGVGLGNIGSFIGEKIGSISGAGMGYIAGGLSYGNPKAGAKLGSSEGEFIGDVTGGVLGTIIGAIPGAIMGGVAGFSVGMAVKASKQLKKTAKEVKELVIESEKKKEERENQIWASFFINMKKIPIPCNDNQKDHSTNKRKKPDAIPDSASSEETHRHLKRHKKF